MSNSCILSKGSCICIRFFEGCMDFFDGLILVRVLEFKLYLLRMAVCEEGIMQNDI